MPICDVCGNDYANPIVITQGQRSMTFDSFECAIEGMAPRCTHCGLRIVGHGVEEGGQIFCSGHCAHHSEASGKKSRMA